MSSTPSTFPEWFGRLGTDPGDPPIHPREWQEDLAREESPRSLLIRIPTGYGKTLGVLAAWLYHRVERNDDRWPRRLVWVLPTRVLVEQTVDEIRKCIGRLGLLWQAGSEHQEKIGVHLLMGGADSGGEWNLYPEENAVFVATQDMALSRALNRGYAAPRARWPQEFGLLSQDALWVFDEVQLMDVGLATSAQLQAFFDDDASRWFRPRISWWMSATLQPDWLHSVDTKARHGEWIRNPRSLPLDALGSGLAAIRKTLDTTEIPAADHKSFATVIADVHGKSPAEGEYGRITLVVCNTVERATATFDALRKQCDPRQELRLVHSRFRPADRAVWTKEFLGRGSCKEGVDRIIVATQVVEAGVDMSATTLITELAPWSSLVQRFGRCARYGGSGTVLVVDRGRDEKVALPYSCEDLEAAKEALDAFRADDKDASIASIETFERELTAEKRNQLYPYQPKQLLLRRDFDELFDTTPDLTGADLDVSSFIRSGNERDISVFWIDLPPVRKGQPVVVPSIELAPRPEELCSIPFLAARDWLCGKATKQKPAPRLLPSRRAWIWDWIAGEWKIAERSALIPGVVVCVAADSGGYREDRGFDPASRDRVSVPGEAQKSVQDEADDGEDSEKLSAVEIYKTIATHGREVGTLATRIASGLVPERILELIGMAGRWHDIGKAHPAFQAAIEKRDAYETRVDLAKAPDRVWQRPCLYGTTDGEKRRGFRHELASCLALFAVLQRYDAGHPALLGPWREALQLTGQDGSIALDSADSSPTELEKQVLACTAEEFDLLAYLVLAHHGKVRVALHAGPKDQEYVASDSRGLPIRGVREGDLLPPIPLDGQKILPALPLSLEPAMLGLSPVTGRSWRERTVALLQRHSPGSLAYLEALLIAADRRASRFTTSDPLLASDPGGGV